MSKRVRIAAIAAAAALLVAAGAVGALVVSGGGSDHKTATGSASAKGYLGLTVTASPTQGLRVASVENDGPAAKAGIQVGDFIRSVDGQLVRTPEQLRAAVEAKAPGAQVSITYDRADQELRSSVKLTTAPPNAQIEATPAAGAQGQAAAPNTSTAGRGQLGVQVATINAGLKQRYGLTRDTGVVITDVTAGSGAAAAGLKAGDIILSVNSRDVTTPEEVMRAVLATVAGQQVSLHILRGSTDMTVTVAMPSASLFPGFENLPPQIQERLLQLAQSGNFTVEQLQRLAAGQNNLRVGTVKAISATSVTLTPLEGGSDVSFALNDKTQYRGPGNATIAASDIKTGATVLVISTDGQTASGVFIYSR
jgi:membrane-associated protease RseP (regulator of RpoE activity)